MLLHHYYVSLLILCNLIYWSLSPALEFQIEYFKSTSCSGLEQLQNKVTGLIFSFLDARTQALTVLHS